MLKIRKFDDKIINILNTELPTESFYSTNINPPKICAQLRHEVICLSILFFKLHKLTFF